MLSPPLLIIPNVIKTHLQHLLFKPRSFVLISLWAESLPSLPYCYRILSEAGRPELHSRRYNTQQHYGVSFWSQADAIWNYSVLIADL